MFIRHRPFRFSTSKSALIAVLGVICFAISSIGADAAGFSLAGPVGVMSKERTVSGPEQTNTLIGANVFTAHSAETLSVAQKGLSIGLGSQSTMISTSLVISQAYGGGGGS